MAYLAMKQRMLTGANKPVVRVARRFTSAFLFILRTI